MLKLSPEEFHSLKEAGYERRNVEFKSPFIWGDTASVWLQENVIRAVLGFANTKDGGDIIIGIGEDDNKKPVLTGLEDAQVTSFNYDSVKGVIDSFASPYINLDIRIAEEEGKRFVVIRVSEFDDIPIICRKDGQNQNVLKRGDIYCRSRSGSPATIRVTEAELREIIELAIDKGQEKLEQRGYVRREIEDVEKIYKEKFKDLEEE